MKLVNTDNSNIPRNLLFKNSLHFIYESNELLITLLL